MLNLEISKKMAEEEMKIQNKLVEEIYKDIENDLID